MHIYPLFHVFLSTIISQHSHKQWEWEGKDSDWSVGHGKQAQIKILSMIYKLRPVI